MNTALTIIRARGLPRGRRAPAGFTLTELLVVIGIIAILVSITLVAVGRAIGTSKRAATQGVLNTLGTAIEAYRADFGAHPPLVTGLDDYGESGPNAIETPEVVRLRARLDGLNESTAVRDAYEDARFYSEWTFGAFLLGAGDLNGDEDTVQGWWEDTDEDRETTADDNIYDDGAVGFGFRNPGTQPGAWKRITGSGLVHSPQRTGQVYGPYLEPGSTERFIERVPVRQDDVLDRIAPDANASANEPNQVMFRFVDSWGNPIRYYRDWYVRDPSDPEAPVNEAFAPVELRSYDALEALYETGEAPSDGYVSRAPFMLLAAGAEPIAVQDEVAGARFVVSPFGDVLQSREDDGDDQTPDEYIRKLVQPSFGSAFDLEALPRYDQEALLELVRSNLRYAP